MTTLLSELREPPVVGRFYMVPVVRFPWSGNVQDWPVAGPLHSDTDFFDFDRLHYHLDPRFFTKRQATLAAREGKAKTIWAADLKDYDPIAISVGAVPLSHRWRDIPKGRPSLAKRLCRAPIWPMYAFSHRPPILAINKAFASAVPIERKDGRRLCPHRKFDLSQLVPDADGFVTCPLHGLRVKCAAIADTHPQDGDVKQAPLVSGGGAQSAIAQPSSSQSLSNGDDNG